MPSQDQTNSNSLFPVFVLSIFTLILGPYTIYRFCCTGEDEVVQPWQKVQESLRPC